MTRNTLNGASRTAPNATGVAVKAPKLKMDALRFALCGLIILGISRVNQEFDFLTAVRPGLLLMGLGMAVALFNPKAIADKSWMKRWTTLLVAALVVSTLGGIAFGISQGGAFYYFENNYSKVLVGAFLLVLAIRNTNDLRLFCWAYVAAAAVLVWMSLVQLGVQHTRHGIDRLNTRYTWDANDVGLVLLVGLPLCLLCFKSATSKFGKVFSGVVIVGIAATIAKTGSRGAFLGLAVVLVAFLFLHAGTSIGAKFGTIAILATGLAIAAPDGYWSQMNTIADAEEDYNWDAATGRRQLAIRGLGYMMQYPIFGIGLENFGRAEGTISDRAINFTPGQAGIKWSAAHNSYLQAGAEMGVPGLIIFTSLVFSCIIIPIRLKRRVPKEWATGDWEQRFLKSALDFVPLSTIGFSVSGFLVSFAYHDPVYILAAFTGGLVQFVNVRLKNDANPARRLGTPLQRSAPIAFRSARTVRTGAYAGRAAQARGTANFSAPTPQPDRS